MDKNQTHSRSNGNTNQPTRNSGISGNNAESGNQSSGAGEHQDPHANKNGPLKTDQPSKPGTGAANDRDATATSNANSDSR